MALDRFWAIFKRKCIYEEKCETVLKRKRSVENLNYKETLILVMQCCCGDNVKYRLLSKRLFQWNQEHDGCKKCQDYNKLLLEIIKWKKNIDETFESLCVVTFQIKYENLSILLSVCVLLKSTHTDQKNGLVLLVCLKSKCKLYVNYILEKRGQLDTVYEKQI